MFTVLISSNEIEHSVLSALMKRWDERRTHTDFSFLQFLAYYIHHLVLDFLSKLWKKLCTVWLKGNILSRYPSTFSHQFVDFLSVFSPHLQRHACWFSTKQFSCSFAKLWILEFVSKAFYVHSHSSKSCWNFVFCCFLAPFFRACEEDEWVFALVSCSLSLSQYPAEGSA